MDRRKRRRATGEESAHCARRAPCHCWSNTGQILVKHCSNTGQTLVTYWSNTTVLLEQGL